jgi:addiction module RelB/DinJ family antitoxin
MSIVANLNEDVMKMATVAYSFRIEEDTKKQLDDICREMGMSTATAFSLFAKRVVAERGLPFKPAAIALPKSQKTLLDALHEAQGMTAGNKISEDEILDAVMEGRSR